MKNPKAGEHTQEFIFRETETGDLWTVGYYHPEGEWEPVSDHITQKAAEDEVSRLNGNKTKLELAAPKILEALETLIKSINPEDVSRNKVPEMLSLGCCVGKKTMSSDEAILIALEAIKAAKGE